MESYKKLEVLDIYYKHYGINEIKEQLKRKSAILLTKKIEFYDMILMAEYINADSEWNIQDKFHLLDCISSIMLNEKIMKYNTFSIRMYYWDKILCRSSYKTRKHFFRCSIEDIRSVYAIISW